jgi:hypothetical protein
MKVLVATCLGQGKAHDVFTAREGEIVFFPPTDQLCHWHLRVLQGVASGGETTTVMVVERPDLDWPEYRELVAGGLTKAKWKIDLDRGDYSISELVEEMLDIADEFDRGTILERVGGDFRVRLHPDWTPGAAA